MNSLEAESQEVQQATAVAVCEQCDWTFTGTGAALCPHCYRANLTPLAAADRPAVPEPELIIPFTVTAADVEPHLAAFARSVPFAPPDLRPETLQQRLQPVFMPAWLVDSDVRALWQAEVGFDYRVVSHQEQYENGGWHTRELEETKVRWEQRVGRLQRHYDNVMAPALEEHQIVAQRLGDFSVADAAPYDPEAADDALLRLPNRDTADAWPDAQLRVQQIAQEECRRASEAQHIRQFRWQAQYDAAQWTQLLLPIYSTCYYDDEQRPRPLLIHGRSGRIAGVKRASMQRAKTYTRNLALLALACFLLTLGLIAYRSPLGVVTGVLTLFLGAAALYPIIRVAQFNQRQRVTLPFATEEEA